MKSPGSIREYKEKVRSLIKSTPSEKLSNTSIAPYQISLVNVKINIPQNDFAWVRIINMNLTSLLNIYFKITRGTGGRIYHKISFDFEGPGSPVDVTFHKISNCFINHKWS